MNPGRIGSQPSIASLSSVKEEKPTTQATPTNMPPPEQSKPEEKPVNQPGGRLANQLRAIAKEFVAQQAPKVAAAAGKAARTAATKIPGGTPQSVAAKVAAEFASVAVPALITMLADELLSGNEEKRAHAEKTIADDPKLLDQKVGPNHTLGQEKEAFKDFVPAGTFNFSAPLPIAAH